MITEFNLTIGEAVNFLQFQLTVEKRAGDNTPASSSKVCC